eukprot:Seg18789.2 transcript_id=Seg18789.2/GoldUCD/mRNA.D3Y31 product="Capsid assembly protease C" protein_id=Seg18789.2/GoldUCD/D3Y31
MKNLTTRISKISKSEEWAITQQGLMNYLTREVPEFALSKINESEVMADTDTTSALRDRFSLFWNQRQSMQIVDNIAIVSVYGPLIQDGSPFDLALGATGYEELIEELERANSNESVKAIMLDIDSPGGMVSGLLEVVETIQSSKPTFAYISGYGCSAAYKLAATCQAIGASASSTSGNIGTILSWYDMSAYLAAFGIEQHVITSEGAELKGTFQESPMPEQQRQFLQDRVNQNGQAFWDHVASNRPQVSDECKRAGWYQPEDAGALGLIDAVGTRSDFLEIIKESVDIKN